MRQWSVHVYGISGLVSEYLMSSQGLASYIAALNINGIHTLSVIAEPVRY